MSSIFKYEENKNNIINIKKLKKNIQLYCSPININNVSKVIHTHEYFQFLYVTSGKAKHYLNGKVDYLVKGDYFFVPPYMAHMLYCEEGDEADGIFMDFGIDTFFKNPNSDAVENDIDYYYINSFFGSTEGILPKRGLSSNTKKRVEECLFELIKMNINSNNDIDVDMLARSKLLSLLSELLIDIKKSAITKPQSLDDIYHQLINTSINYIKLNFQNNIKCEDVTSKICMSQTYFRQLFKSITGKTFTQYLIDLRINSSIDLITTTKLSITEICYKVGFNDFSHFLRTFKKEVGLSPAEYRNVYSKSMKNSKSEI